MKRDYLSVVYDEARTPKTEYPTQFAGYIVRRYRLQLGSSFLEIGCGRGDFLKAFNHEGMKCSGVDIEKRSAELLEGFDIRVCDVSKDRLPFEDEFFDVVYHKSLIEHMFDSRILMAETHRILKRGGKVVILTPDWVSQMRNFYEDITHCRPYDVTALHDTMTMSGFEDVQVEVFNQLPVLWNSRSMRLLASFARLLLNVHAARFLTAKTGIKFFRWSVELMVLGYGVKR